jgi:hypothetical protein
MRSIRANNTFRLTSYQLSYSTADIERNVFYAPNRTVVRPTTPVEKVTVLVVNDEMYGLDNQNIPAHSIPLTDESGLFDLVPAVE